MADVAPDNDIKHSIKHVTPEECELSAIVTDISCSEGCDKSFANSSAHSLHLKLVHKIKRKNVLEGTTWFHCPVATCRYSDVRTEERKDGRKWYFLKMKYLKQHYLKVHGVRDFICDICQMAFSAKAFLAQHLRICGLILQCSCGVTSSALETLQTHSRRLGHSLSESTRAALRLRKASVVKIVKKTHPSENKKDDINFRCLASSVDIIRPETQSSHHWAAVVLTEFSNVATSVNNKLNVAHISTQTEADSGFRRVMRRLYEKGELPERPTFNGKRKRTAETQTQLTTRPVMARKRTRRNTGTCKLERDGVIEMTTGDTKLMPLLNNEFFCTPLKCLEVDFDERSDNCLISNTSGTQTSPRGANLTLTRSCCPAVTQTNHRYQYHGGINLLLNSFQKIPEHYMVSSQVAQTDTNVESTFTADGKRPKVPVVIQTNSKYPFVVQSSHRSHASSRSRSLKKTSDPISHFMESPQLVKSYFSDLELGTMTDFGESVAGSHVFRQAESVGVSLGESACIETQTEEWGSGSLLIELNLNDYLKSNPRVSTESQTTEAGMLKYLGEDLFCPVSLPFQLPEGEADTSLETNGVTIETQTCEQFCDIEPFLDATTDTQTELFPELSLVNAHTQTSDVNM